MIWKKGFTNMTNTWSKTKYLAFTSMLIAIIFILTFTPLGFIPLPIVNATTIHIPVILGALIMGPKYGAVLGTAFGFASLLRNTFAPTAASFVFSPFYPLPDTESGNWMALIVVFIPRIMVGVVPWFFYQGMSKVLPKRLDVLNFGLSGVIGSLTNTLLVMHLIFLLFREPYAAIIEQPVYAVYTFIMGIILANGVPEAIVAGILIAALGRVFKIIVNQ